tara:strand:- start:46398 stop:47552 length:1155 start_codon:yes stop_codon:yes gene_type:complete
MASPHKRRRKRAIADLLGGTVGSATLVKEALEYMIFGGGSKGKSSLVADGAVGAPSKVDALLDNAGILSSMSQLDTKYLAHVTLGTSTQQDGQFVKIGDKYFKFDAGSLPAATGTTVSYNHDGDAGTAAVTAVVVGLQGEADSGATCAAQLKAAIESANGFAGKISASIEVGGGTDQLLLSWSPRDYGQLSLTDGNGAGDDGQAVFTRSTGRGGSLGGHAPIHYVKASAEYTGNSGILFFINGPACKYIQNSADMSDDIVAKIKPGGFGANKAIHFKFVASMATGDTVKVEALDNDTEEAFAEVSPVAGLTDLQAFTGSPISNKGPVAGIDVAAAAHTLGEFLVQYDAEDVDDGIAITYARANAEAAISGGGFALHWEVIDWAA